MAVNVVTDLTAAQQLASFLDNAYWVGVSKNPVMNLFPGALQGLAGNQRRIQPDNTGKFSYSDELRTESKGTLNANYTAGAGSLTVVSTSMFKVGDIIWIEGHKDANFIRVTFRVTAIPGGTTLTVTQIGGTDTSLTSTGQLIRRVSTTPDNSYMAEATVGATTTEPTKVDQYIQIFNETFELGQLALDQWTYQLALGSTSTALDALAIEQRLQALTYQLYQAFMHLGTGQAQTATVGASMKSVQQFINTASAVNRVNAGAATLTEDNISDAVEKIALRGLSTEQRLLIIASTAQARRISALRHAKVTYADSGTEQAFGTQVQIYHSELAFYGQNMMIVADQNQTDDTIFIVNPALIELVGVDAHPTLEVVDAERPGQLGIRKTMRLWQSMILHGALDSHAVIYNLV